MDDNKTVRKFWSVVKIRILIPGNRELDEYKDRSLLSEKGRPIVLDWSWANSFLKQICFVKRHIYVIYEAKWGTCGQKTAYGFRRTEVFVFWKKKIISEHNIPKELNFDQSVLAGIEQCIGLCY